ncbi:hypothetical protein SAMN05216368_109137 [Cryobacterium flavum]|uniref:Uncharacterized protein n=1 Tax=Cryobacterium flavum TaxID=1424659 RepID=A0A5E9G284_9MICO|nr:hypothetical protein SAMN05216368_109137 [Cryobacterium flavum]
MVTVTAMTRSVFAVTGMPQWGLVIGGPRLPTMSGVIRMLPTAGTCHRSFVSFMLLTGEIGNMVRIVVWWHRHTTRVYPVRV